MGTEEAPSKRPGATTARKPRILFIYQHNSGRSQIAAAYFEKYAGDHFEVESAGLEPADEANPPPDTFSYRAHVKN